MNKVRTILISGNFAPFSNDDAIANGFEALGVKTIRFYDQGAYDRLYPQLGKSVARRVAHRFLWQFLARPVGDAFLRFVQEHRSSVDAVLVLKGWFFHPDVLKKLRIILPGVPVVCFNPDNFELTRFLGVSNSWIQKAVPQYDCYCTWGRFLMEPLKRLGARKVAYVPFAYDPEAYHLIQLSDADRKHFGSDINFVGVWDKEREQWLKDLALYDLKIWGNEWHRARGSLRAHWVERFPAAADVAKIYQASKISLNLIRQRNLPAGNMRSFEIPATGGFQLSTYAEELNDVFADKESIVYFKTPGELRERIDFYLAHNRECIRIAANGLRVVQGHSIRDRAQTMLAALSKLPEG